MLNRSAQTLLLIPALLVLLISSAIADTTYIWADANGNLVVTSEKPPANVTDYDVIGDEQTADETGPPPPTDGVADEEAQYKDFPPLVLEQIRRTARDRWPGKPDAQAAMVDRQVRACRYVIEARTMDFPVDGRDHILRYVDRLWPDDYGRQADYIARQYKAYQAVLYYENLDLPYKELETIKTRVAERWPFDYVKQESFMRREADYRIEQIRNQEPEDRITGLRSYNIRELNEREGLSPE